MGHTKYKDFFRHSDVTMNSVPPSGFGISYNVVRGLKSNKNA